MSRLRVAHSATRRKIRPISMDRLGHALAEAYVVSASFMNQIIIDIITASSCFFNFEIWVCRFHGQRSCTKKKTSTTLAASRPTTGRARCWRTREQHPRRAGGKRPRPPPRLVHVRRRQPLQARSGTAGQDGDQARAGRQVGAWCVPNWKEEPFNEGLMAGSSVSFGPSARTMHHHGGASYVW